MIKPTVLLLSGAFLAITGGASVARGGELAMLECFVTFTTPGWAVGKVDTSFDTPEECVGEVGELKAAASVQRR